MSQAKKILIATIVLLLLLGAYWGWKTAVDAEKLVPGTTVFRTYFDDEHGMAVTNGTFALAGGATIYLSCWSPRVLQRNAYYKFIIWRPSRSGTKTEGTLTITAGTFTASFDGLYGEMAPEQRTTFWPDNDMTREQLRQIASAPQAEFKVDAEQPLFLRDDQLAEIRAFLAYTEHLPEYNPMPADMR